MQADGFRSTRVGNKPVYRTRMAISDGGELLARKTNHRKTHSGSGSN
jgi:hypothetical protein